MVQISSPLSVRLVMMPCFSSQKYRYSSLAFFAQEQAVRAAAEHRTEGADELAFLVEDHDTVGAGAILVYRVVNVDVALCILHDAVGVAVLDVRGQLAPIVDALVLVLALAEDRGSWSRTLSSDLRM